MENRTVVWRGLNVSVTEVREPASEPWDGEEPLDPGSEGWDLAVEVGLDVDGHVFSARDSICGNWIMPNREGLKYLDSQVEEILAEALSSLDTEIKRVASGEEVRRAEKRKMVAMVVAGLPA